MTVNIKYGGRIEFEGQTKVIVFQIAETINCAFMCDKPEKILGFIYNLEDFLCFPNLRVKSPSVEYNPTDSNTAHSNYVKTSE